MNVAIQASRLSKQYAVGTREPYSTLRDALSRTIRSAVSGLKPGMRNEAREQRTLWALKDVSFTVRHGDVLGIIGRNGSGKSTLLKILSRITEPTSGRAEVRGLVGSLLEVGTGFHPELTGRENIFVNGAILGMGRHEIERKFDEIVAFADVEPFIDTPVKRYSSGMQMRLAFAVAAHLEPHILLIDEVLAVGDAQFQRKCLNAMAETAKAGRTILFVSHQMNQVRKLCTTAVWLEHGEVQQFGEAHEVISAYEARFSGRGDGDTDRVEQPLTSQFVSWSIQSDPEAEPGTVLEDDRPAILKFRMVVTKRINRGHHGIALFNSDNLLIWAYAFDNLALDPGTYEFCYTFPSLPVRPGVYHWDFSMWEDGTLIDRWNALPPMRVHTPMRTHASDAWQGVLSLQFAMDVQPADNADGVEPVLAAHRVS